jgi:carboxymethylenebutenolidase
MSCEDCTKGNVLPGEPTGAIDTVSKAYLAAAPEPSSRAVILLTDVFGLPLQNCKILADRLSKELACDVWVPDMFDGARHLSVSSYFI